MKVELIKVKLMKVDEPTINGHIYKKETIEREIDRLRDSMDRRRFFGRPFGSTRSIGDVSHLVTNLEVRDDGMVEAEVEVLDTPNGKILRDTIICGGVKFGFSGIGCVSDGIVGDDFVLESVDVDIGTE